MQIYRPIIVLALITVACGGSAPQTETPAPAATPSLMREGCDANSGMAQAVFLERFEGVFASVWCPGVGAGCFSDAPEVCTQKVRGAIASCSAQIALPPYVCGEEHGQQVGTVLGECIGGVYDASNPQAMACPHSQACTDALTQLGQDATCSQ